MGSQRKNPDTGESAVDVKLFDNVVVYLPSTEFIVVILFQVVALNCLKQNDKTHENSFYLLKKM